MHGKNTPPQVSIIIPTYNRRHVIQRALKSILEQTYQDFEIIIIDDCSSDNTEHVISPIRDSRIKYMRLDKQKGAAFARNVGIREAQGCYIGFADSDDEWHSFKLQKQIDYLMKSDGQTGLVYSSVWRVKDGCKRLFPAECRHNTVPMYIHEKLLYRNFITIHVLLRRECLEKAGLFDENLPRLQDWDLWLRISKYYKVGFLPEPLATVYMSEDAISRDDEKRTTALKNILKKYIDDYNQYPTILAKNYYLLGRLFELQNKMDISLEFLKKAVKVKPFNVKYRLILAALNFIPKVFSPLSRIKNEFMKRMKREF